MKLPAAFYQRHDVVKISKELLGKVLCTNIDNFFTSGIITETEAYAGVTDRACHAYNNRRTKRTEIMYREGGHAYIYLCYGLFSLLNFTANKKDVPEAILVRAIQPLEGIEIMEERRRKTSTEKKFTAGPGTLTQALGIHFSMTGEHLEGDKIWIEDRGLKVKQKDILAGPRVGIDYAKEDALLPYRFILKNL